MACADGVRKGYSARPVVVDEALHLGREGRHPARGSALTGRQGPVAQGDLRIAAVGVGEVVEQRPADDGLSGMDAHRHTVTARCDGLALHRETEWPSKGWRRKP